LGPFVTVILSKLNVPDMAEKLIPVPPLLVTETSDIEILPIPEDGSFIPVLFVVLILSPRTVVLLFNVTVFPRVVKGLAVFMLGNESLLDAGTTDARLARLSLESCPINF